MTVERTASFKKDYKALNAASKMRVDIALGRLLKGHPDVEVLTVDYFDGIEAAVVDDFLCVTFERISDGVRLLNVRSIETAGA